MTTEARSAAEAQTPPDRSKVFVMLAALVVMLAGLKLARELVVPVLIGVMVAATASPIVTFLLHKRVPPILVAAIALTVDLVIVGGLGAIFVVAAGDLRAFVPRYTMSVDHADASVAQWLAAHGAPHVEHPLPAILRGQGLSELFAGMANTVAVGVSGAAMVLLVAFFTLCEVTTLGDKLRALSHNADAHFSRVNDVIRQVQRYLVVKVLICALAAVLSYITLRLFNIELALLLAFIVFLFHFIPNVGPLISMIPAIAVALITRGVGTAAGVYVSMQLIALLCGNIIEPRLLGRTLGLSPLTVLLSMLFWAWMWGPLGAVLAVPLTAVLKIVLENSKGLEWTAHLLETAPDLAPPEKRKARITQHPMLRRPTYIIGGR